MKQNLNYWCSPGYPGDPSNDPPEIEKSAAAVIELIEN